MHNIDTIMYKANDDKVTKVEDAYDCKIFLLFNSSHLIRSL